MKTDMKTDMTTISSTSFGSGESSESERKTLENIDTISIEQRVADLESRPRMPSSGSGINGDVLALDGTNPRWEKSDGLPAIEVGDEEHMSLTLIDVAGVLTPQWAYRLLQQ